VRFEKASIPLGFVWSSPFARWQGPLAELSSLDTAVQVTGDGLAERGLATSDVDALVLGWTVPQPASFYGASTVAARLGAGHVSGPMISQACATSVACVQAAAATPEAGADDVTLVVVTDRTSNGPHLVYPSPSSVGGQADDRGLGGRQLPPGPVGGQADGPDRGDGRRRGGFHQAGPR
jgi:Acetyl-CoA acetyltransferase